MKLPRYARAIWLIKWRQLAVRVLLCPVCSVRRAIVRLDNNEIAVRCVWCGASAITMSMVSVIRYVVPNLNTKHVYELSSRGPFVNFLARHAHALTCSEYFEQQTPGTLVNGVRCEDVQALTFPNESFDVCTSTEVFEHVPDDRRGYGEINRVLKPGGLLVFTVPLGSQPITIERARMTREGSIEHLLPPEYHIDPLRGHRPVLAFRTYGQDIVERVQSQGFDRVDIVTPRDHIPWGFARRVIVARKRS